MWWNPRCLYTTILCVHVMHTRKNHVNVAGQRIVRSLIRHDAEIVAYRTGRFHLSLYSYNSAAKIRNVLISENKILR